MPASSDPRLRFPKAQIAYAADPRFSYCLHLPTALLEDPKGFRLLIAVHGSARGCMAYRDALAPFADRNRYVVLAPLFPVGALGDGNPDGYKYIAEGSIRYDRILLGMIAEVEALLGIAFPRFDLFGFSGGGHFAHRFYYLHPDRLASVSVGAPGGVTLIDDSRDFWIGTRDFAQRFGAPLDLEAMRKVPSQLIIGELDTEEFVYPSGFAAHSADMASLGRNRLERNATLLRNWLEHSMPAAQTIVPGIAHAGLSATPAVERFLENLVNLQAPA
ncbi:MULTISPECIES: hypothetical protein [unclassified Sphingomonas]|uniref:alpha/beta fold hydrolase n=1 Tax=unclassified Sphingomonas TaxID=196159 RepID=UPI000929E6BC|nr:MULTISPECIES: hypothetical protein [unclassified Sphingomonas]OJU22465.1 MAG: hypothetical protein BGN95_02700 [Sphingomonas sp. 66-10]